MAAQEVPPTIRVGTVIKVEWVPYNAGNTKWETKWNLECPLTTIVRNIVTVKTLLSRRVCQVTNTAGAALEPRAATATPSTAHPFLQE